MLGRWQQVIRGDLQLMTSTVRYRLLMLLMMPVLLTLSSLVFITIYWNVTYTGTQLFMQVRSDLSVAQGIMESQTSNRAQELHQLQHDWALQQALSELSPAQLTQRLSQQQQRLGLSFLRFVSVVEVTQNPNFMKLLAQPYSSGLQRLSAAELAAIKPELAESAQVSLVPTLMAHQPLEQQITDGLVMRTLVPVISTEALLLGYLDAGVLFNHNNSFVDTVQSLVYGHNALPYNISGHASVLLDNVRISTNVLDNQVGNRVIGSLVSDQVQHKVLGEAQMWIDRAFVFDDWYVSAYAPLSDIHGQRIGMLYVGFTEAPFIGTYLVNIMELGLVLLLVLLSSGWVVYRGAAGLLTPIDRISTVVTAVQAGDAERRIGDLGLNQRNELAQLAQQFDQMLDQLQERSQQIQLANDQLELKVEQRTRSLQERTQQLKQNIQLLNSTREQMVTNEKLVALGELTAGIAHEINNPTAVILGNIELIKWELTQHPAQVDEEVELIVQQVQRINAIIQSLLQYARPGEMSMPVTLEAINPIIEEMLVLVRHSLNAKSVSVVLDLQADQPACVNRQQLLQVLINLVVNAAHATDGDGEVRVLSRNWVSGDGAPLGVQIRVEDDGCGIEPELQSRIFDPFFTTRKQGTGLGLSLSYGIVRRFGGILELESQPDKGSVFTVKLPNQAPLKSRDPHNSLILG